MDLQSLLDVQKELQRFEKKLKTAIVKVAEDAYYFGKETGAVKRAALDLKNELTKITR